MNWTPWISVAKNVVHEVGAEYEHQKWIDGQHLEEQEESGDEGERVLGAEIVQQILK